MNNVLTNKKQLMKYLNIISGNKVKGLELFTSVLIEDIERAIANDEDVDYTRALTCLSWEAVSK